MGFDIWLTGILIVDADHREHVALWADDPQERTARLRVLGDICSTRPGLPIVTWAGTSADLPKLRDAAQRHAGACDVAALDARHLDLYQHAARTVRLPMSEFGLRAVAAYFAIPTTSTIGDGRDAQMLYDEYRACPDPQHRTEVPYARRDHSPIPNERAMSIPAMRRSRSGRPSVISCLPARPQARGGAGRFSSWC